MEDGAPDVLGAFGIDDSSRPRDLHQHCSICHFHFWQRRKIFYLGRYQDLIHDVDLEDCGQEQVLAGKNDILFFGERYFFTFDGSGWRPLPWQGGILQARALGTIWSKQATGSTDFWPRFPICWDCFRCIQQFMSFRNEHPRHAPAIKDLQSLYRVLFAQWNSESMGSSAKDNACWKLDWPHGSYRGPFLAYDRFSRARLLTENATSESADAWMWILGDPYRPLPSLPEFLLTHLQPVEGVSGEDDSFFSRSTPRPSQSSSGLMQLPHEVLDGITSYLETDSCFALRQTCTRLANAIPLDQRFWYEKFMHHKLFGFFFDFDIIKVTDETRSKCKKRGKLPPQWDWRRLVRELANFSSFQNGGIMADAPSAFRNRRRIWRILEMAEVYHRKALGGVAC